ncbi:hypothetical protein Tco_0507696, partial [Tanacetum coccineum]
LHQTTKGACRLGLNEIIAERVFPLCWLVRLSAMCHSKDSGPNQGLSLGRPSLSYEIFLRGCWCCRVWKSRTYDLVLRGADGNVMGIHDFLCLPEWTGAEVQEEPHHSK